MIVPILPAVTQCQHERVGYMDMTARTTLHWLDVLCQHWDQLSEEMQEQVQQCDFWCLIAEQ